MGTFLKADLHVHSSASFDCTTPPKDIVREAKKKGLDIIGITDHGTRRGGLDVQHSRGIMIIPGQEVKTRQGDILVFGVDRDLDEGQDVAATCRKANELGGVIIIPHPFDPLREGVGKSASAIAKYAVAVEGFNPKCFFNWSNTKAVRFAAEHNISAIASSDAHRPGEVGRAYTLMEGDPFDALREGKVSMVVGTVQKGKLLKKRLRKVWGK